MDILVVDDDASIRDLAVTVLSDVGTVRTAANAEEAEREVIRSRPDVVVLDVMMPEVSGLELLDGWRRDAQMATVPVVLLTARSESSDRRSGYRSGADAYVTKPFEPEVLVAMVRQAVVDDRSVSAAFLRELGNL